MLGAEREHPSDVSRAAILYDGSCPFCRWSVALVLAWDRGRRLRAVSLQDPEAVALLPGMDAERRLASWHLVTPAGRIHSAGAALAPLLRLLPGGRPLARLAAAFPSATARAYDWVAARRGVLGGLLGRRTRDRADRRIERRSH